ncbi:MAG: PH domain-containing protein, partial [Bacilli bacterium]
AEDCKSLKDILLHKEVKPIEGEVSKDLKFKRANNTEILMLGLLQSNFLIIFQLFSIIGAGIPILNSIFQGEILKEQNISLEVINSINSIFIGLILILFVMLVGTIISVIVNSVKYMGFQISDRNESINIEYGLFNKKQHSIVKDKICGYSYKQPLLMRLFKTGYVEVIAIGYGGMADDSVESSTSFLFPFVKKGELDKFINQWIPDLVFREKISQCSNAPIRYFLPSMSVFFSTIFLSLSIIYAKTINDISENFIHSFSNIVITICGFYFVVSIVSILIERSCNGIGGNSNVVKVITGGINLTTSLVFTKNLEYISQKGSILKRNKDCANIKFGIFGPATRNIFKVRNMCDLSYKSLKEVLKY